jgi:predicted transcriptional regulator
MEYHDLLSCVFSLSDFEVEVYRTLTKVGEFRVDDLSKQIKRERTAVYRALQKLVSCGIYYKNTKTPQHGGGYYHVYSVAPLNLVKKKIEDRIEEWYKTMKETLKRFGAD